MASQGPNKGPIFHPVATGAAARTVKAHEDETNMIFWAGWFCPFTQRSWIVLEEKSIAYTYREVNPYLKDPGFLAISPNGTVPVIQDKGKPIHDSTEINFYLENSYWVSRNATMIWLLPAEQSTRDTAFQWIAYINATVVPAFFHLLQAQADEIEKRKVALEELEVALMTVSSVRKGPFFFGPTFGLVDATIAPWAVRDFIVRDYRGFRREEVPAWKEWAEQLERRESVVNTTSDLDKYVEFNGRFLRNEQHSLVGIATSHGQAII